MAFLIVLNFSIHFNNKINKTIIKIYNQLIMFDHLFITGFKKFDNLDVNPTQMVVQELEKQKMPRIQCQTLDVTVEHVNEYIKTTKKQQSKLQGKVLNLHFGVGPNKVYNLEKKGYNNKDFRIPDNNGNQFKNEQICSNEFLDYPINCKMDLENLKQNLKNHKMILSNDPGRYICNYIYFKSLHELSSQENVTSLFIHFPVHKIASHKQNMEFMTDLLKVLVKKKNLK